MMSELSADFVGNLIKRIENALSCGAEILLFKVSSKMYNEVVHEVLRYFTSFAEGVYVSLNKPCSSLKRLLSSAGVNVEKLVFVDCVSRQFSEEENGACIYVNSPDPVHIQVALKRAMNLVNSDFKFVFLDSLSTISLYKSNETLVKFVRQISGKLRTSGFIGLFFTLDGELDHTIYSQIFLMSDEVIEVS